MGRQLSGDVLALFKPNQPLIFVPPPPTHSLTRLTGISNLLNQFETALPEGAEFTDIESTFERKKRIMKERKELNDEKIKEKLRHWDPKKDKNLTKEPDNTIIVTRLSYEATESQLIKVFGAYGKIRHVRIIKDQKGKPKGYAFVEYERKDDAEKAYRQANGIEIDKRRVVVDKERGRIRSSWRPRRLGGGIGSTREANDLVSEAVLGIKLKPLPPKSGQKLQPFDMDQFGYSSFRPTGANSYYLNPTGGLLHSDREHHSHHHSHGHSHHHHHHRHRSHDKDKDKDDKDRKKDKEGKKDIKRDYDKDSESESDDERDKKKEKDKKRRDKDEDKQMQKTKRKREQEQSDESEGEIEDSSSDSAMDDESDDGKSGKRRRKDHGRGRKRRREESSDDED
ncbi:MAG: putative U1 small nuclear ribonucleoprotein 70 kDa [Streblomastix strix]|uniref:Putative U1 small nuclear ribonucleoprotein 70 kDa n=1 Tax=Streblomastix strix TaxID=222440 RepID=A0A5J4WFX9_9EUKA|nr:MAG: putative U1 small nuclear ribonucleoprotein 70 kDa [Streblomastix strix]